MTAKEREYILRYLAEARKEREVYDALLANWRKQWEAAHPDLKCYWSYHPRRGGYVPLGKLSD
jgi:hypothetical protein